MTDYYVTLPDVETFDSLKGSYPLEYSEGGIIQSPGWSVDTIGEGQVKVVGWEESGEPILEPIPGFMVNLRSDYDLPDSLIEYQNFPVTPLRVWA